MFDSFVPLLEINLILLVILLEFAFLIFAFIISGSLFRLKLAVQNDCLMVMDWNLDASKYLPGGRGDRSHQATSSATRDGGEVGRKPFEDDDVSVATTVSDDVIEDCADVQGLVWDEKHTRLN